VAPEPWGEIMAESAVRRPAGVTLVAVLIWISGGLDIISGIILLTQSGDPEMNVRFAGQTGFFSVGVTSIVLGAIAIIVAIGLWRGNTAARMIITVIEVLSIIGSLFLAIAYIGEPIGEWIGIVVSLVAVILLWSRKASEFFNA
jgi:hypothetical protein